MPQSLPPEPSPELSPELQTALGAVQDAQAALDNLTTALLAIHKEPK